MSKNRLLTVFSTFVAVAMLVGACSPAATPIPATEAPAATVAPAATEAPAPTAAPTDTAVPPTPDATGTATAELGTDAHPIKVLFVPSVDANVITTGGETMAAALEKATGLKFKVSVPTSYAATIEEVCASPADTMVFIPALGYAIANQLCGVDVAFKAVRFGFPVYWAQILVPRDSDIKSIADLNGKKWGYTDVASTSGYMVPLVMWTQNKVVPSEAVSTGGHPQSVQALYDGKVDFSTSFYSVPLNPDGKPAWSYQDFLDGKVTEDMYDLPADVIKDCKPSADGKKLDCDGWTVLDARSNVRTQDPDVMQKLKILAVSPAIPNDTLSFGPDFPAETRAKIESALVDFSKTDDWKTSIGSSDFYGWSGIEPAKDEEYDFVRQMVEAVGLKLEDLGK